MFRPVAAAPAEPNPVKHLSRSRRQQGWLGKAAAGLRAVQGAARAVLLHTRSLTTFVILHSSFGILPAAPPPELTVLRTQYEKVLAERVTAPFEASLSDLNDKYMGGLDRAIAEAKQAGDLKSVLAIEAEKKRLTDKLPIPAEDDDETPPALKKLRPIYREQWKKLNAQSTANHGAILPAYQARLQALEATLTKADRVDEAKEVMEYREGLAVGATSAIAETKPAANGTTAPATDPEPITDTGPKVSAEDAARQLVEWAVRNGHKAMITGRKGPLTVTAPQDIPEQKFNLLKIESLGGAGSHEALPWRLFQFTPEVDRLYVGIGDKTVVGPDDVAMLRKLKQLKSLEFKGKVVETRALVAAMPPLPSLSELIIAVGIGGDELAMLADKYPQVTGLAFVPREGVSDSDFAALDRFKHVERLRLDWLKEPLTAGKARVIARMPALISLGSMFPFVAPLDTATAALLPNIKTAHLHYKVPRGTVEGLCALPSLNSLMFRNFDAFAEEHLTAITSVSGLTELNLDGISKLDDAALTRILTALPALKELRIVNCGSITDAALSSLTGLKNLVKLTLGKNTALSADAVFAHCKGLGKLKNLSVKDTAISDAALAAFKKARKDVEVEK
ncbi:MAG: hypothetical protein K1X78_16845 [Verrucomicrobiaceae bacterium]|nr:hypothetical protein [Verrucomicrobiaceae bacterium]